jgi:FAD-linked sulfhydryl oxidase
VEFDSSDRPTSAAVLGRATWTMLHTTAAYLPDKFKPEEAAGLKDLVSSVVNLYPGDWARLVQSIIDDPIFRSEFDETDTAEHAQLVICKLHNAVSAAVWPHRWPLPEFLGFQTDLFVLQRFRIAKGTGTAGRFR